MMKVLASGAFGIVPTSIMNSPISLNQASTSEAPALRSMT